MEFLQFRKLALAIGLVILAIQLPACSTARKTTPELSQLEGKKVALVEVEGEETARRVVEVALVNQLLKHGSFDLISKQDLATARSSVNQDPMDWKGLARRAGADFALRANVLKFVADTKEGYSSEEVEDSQLEVELGNGKTNRLYKVKAMSGDVQVRLEFTDLKSGETRVANAVAQDQEVSEAKTTAAHLSPKLRFLENLANEAFKRFFEEYH